MNPLDSLPKDPLTPAQEQEFASGSDREGLILGSMRFAFAYLRTISKAREKDDTLISLTYEALVKAAKNFKPGMQRFIPYAKPYLRGALFAYWKQNIFHPDQSMAPFAQDVDDDCGVEVPPRILPRLTEVAQPLIDSIHFKLVWEDIGPWVSKLLTDREREVINLIYNHNLSVPEVQVRLKVKNRQAIHSTLKRAFKKLRQPVAEYLKKGTHS